MGILRSSLSAPSPAMITAECACRRFSVSLSSLAAKPLTRHCRGTTYPDPGHFWPSCGVLESSESGILKLVKFYSNRGIRNAYDRIVVLWTGGESDQEYRYFMVTERLKQGFTHYLKEFVVKIYEK